MRRPSRRNVLAGAMGLPVVLAFSPGRQANGAPSEHLVEIGDFRFKPDRLEAKPGDTVRFVNRDLAPHTATADDGSWTTGELKRGESELIAVTDGMSGSYFCTYHPHMRARLIL